MEWDPSLETGDRKVDDDHRRMHAMLAELEHAERRETDETFIREMLERLTEHAAVHFAHEERLMDESGYPRDAMVVHLEAHRELTAEVRGLVLEYRAGRLADLSPVTDFLRGWLTTHIREVDRALVDHVRRDSGPASA